MCDGMTATIVIIFSTAFSRKSRGIGYLIFIMHLSYGKMIHIHVDVRVQQDIASSLESPLCLLTPDPV